MQKSKSMLVLTLKFCLLTLAFSSFIAPAPARKSQSLSVVTKLILAAFSRRDTVIRPL
jgi:hypothetical protein